ncbi:MAG: hypothetical protein EOO38_20465 [Cytophagaceae bacterium]|nr:MAG: hypothetical protein EOO38_20465 [Cytophagaceae bacterium]
MTFYSDEWKVAATPDYLSWRYLMHPTNKYDMYVLWSGLIPIGVQITKRLRWGVNMLIDQFVPSHTTNAATGLLPLITVCFWPESYMRALSGTVLILSWTKRIPVFLTYTPAATNTTDAARLGLSASDF